VARGFGLLEDDVAAEGLAVVVDLGNENGIEDVLVDELGGIWPKLNVAFDADSVLLGRPAPSVGLPEELDVGAENEEDVAVGLKGGSPPKEGGEAFVPLAAGSEVEGADSFGLVVGNLNENPPVPLLAGAAVDVPELKPLNGGISGILCAEKEEPRVDSVAGCLNANGPVGRNG
jgi:hypothetical protein